jgi:hypothetical protein
VPAGQRGPGGGQPDGLARPPEHGEHVGDQDVGPPQVLRLAAVLGQPERLPQAVEPFLGATEVGEVHPEDPQRPERASAAGRRLPPARAVPFALAPLRVEAEVAS